MRKHDIEAANQVLSVFLLLMFLYEILAAQHIHRSAQHPANIAHVHFFAHSSRLEFFQD